MSIRKGYIYALLLAIGLFLCLNCQVKCNTTE